MEMSFSETTTDGTRSSETLWSRCRKERMRMGTKREAWPARIDMKEQGITRDLAHVLLMLDAQ